ncbi:MAG: beta-ketoacyl synthase N-terminal-like domain-containing protein [Polyangiaceae bacterium]
MVELSALPASDTIIAGVGARTASGLTALQVTMSARAGKFAPRESHMVDREGEPIATARLLSIADNVFGLERFAALAAPPLVQAAHPWVAAQQKRAEGAGLRVFLALPPASRPGVDPMLRAQLLPLLASRTRLPLDTARSAVVSGCRGGGIAAFEMAMGALASGEEAVLAGGVDSYFDPDVLEWLDGERRLHGPSTENGFVPGEGAAFVLLVARRRAGPFERLGQVLSAAVEMEPNPYGSDRPRLGVGLTRAVRRAVAAVGARSRRIPWVMTDVANERHRVDEWMCAMGRNHRAFSEDVVHDQPLLKTGDVGAASAALLAAMAVTRWQARCAQADVALVAASSDTPERGAAVLSVDPGVG